MMAILYSEEAHKIEVEEKNEWSEKDRFGKVA
jgi:hypothetical protein